MIKFFFPSWYIWSRVEWTLTGVTGVGSRKPVMGNDECGHLEHGNAVAKFHALASVALKWRLIPIHYFLRPRLRINCWTFQILDRLYAVSAATVAIHNADQMLQRQFENIHINCKTSNVVQRPENNRTNWSS